MNDQTLPQTGRLRRNFKNELTQAALTATDDRLLESMRQTMADLRKAMNAHRRELGLELEPESNQE